MSRSRGLRKCSLAGLFQGLAVGVTPRRAGVPKKAIDAMLTSGRGPRGRRIALEPRAERYADYFTTQKGDVLLRDDQYYIVTRKVSTVAVDRYIGSYPKEYFRAARIVDIPTLKTGFGWTKISPGEAKRIGRIVRV